MPFMLAALLLCGPSFGVMADEDPFFDLIPLSGNALDAARGGFRIGAFDVQLGLTIQTLVDGAPVVETHFSVQSDGSLVPVAPGQTAFADRALSMMAQGGALVIGPQGIVVADGTVMPISEVGVRIIENSRNGISIAQRMKMTVIMENMETIAQIGRLSFHMGEMARASVLIKNSR